MKQKIISYPHKARPAMKVNQVAYMQAAIDGVRDGLTASQVRDRNDLRKTQLSYAYRVLREAPDLTERVLSGELSLSKANQMITKGEMYECPVCEGKGYIFRKRA